MNRRKFIRNSCLACMAGISMMELLDSCTTSQQSQAVIKDSKLIVPLSDFEYVKNNQLQYRQHVIVHQELLAYPICVFRIDENTYSALWMSCSHQGAELQVYGQRLQCPAHGSEFDDEGNVLSPPASQPLRKFPIKIDGDNLKISLS